MDTIKKIINNVETGDFLDNDGKFYFNFHKKRYKFLTKLILSSPHDGKCLDIGAYPFQMLEIIKMAKIDIEGVDVDLKSKRTLDFLKKKDLVVKEANISKTKLPYKKNSISLCVFSEVIEHLANPLVALYEINRVMEKNGTLIVTTPNLHSIGRIFKYLSGKGFEQNMSSVYQQEIDQGFLGHIREFFYYELKNLLEKSGFRIKKRYFKYYDFPKKNKIVIPFYILFSFFRPFQVVVAEKI
ncbi:MAG: class I SAM-dependent methyltransferase [Bacteroidales bacterium]|jgi:ubiquinone/menaquinone biosynthesis C-methylase UbiE|nr:class I SAM-dependent methyltransferase [Bacteroidales bacterium]